MSILPLSKCVAIPVLNSSADIQMKWSRAIKINQYSHSIHNLDLLGDISVVTGNIPEHE
jgi:hypothetical protein